jgi:hypothetical protein
MQLYTTLYFESGWSLLAMLFGLDCTLVQCIAHSIYLSMYAVYQRIYNYRVFVQGVRIPDALLRQRS